MPSKGMKRPGCGGREIAKHLPAIYPGNLWAIWVLDHRRQ